MGLTIKLSNLILVGIAAMRAVRAIGPPDGFKMLAGLVLVVKDGSVRFVITKYPCVYPIDGLSRLLCKVHNCVFGTDRVEYEKIMRFFE